MQIWQLFIILKQPVHISVTVIYNLTKLTSYLFYLYYQIINRFQRNKMMQEAYQPYTLLGLTVTRLLSQDKYKTPQLCYSSTTDYGILVLYPFPQQSQAQFPNEHAEASYETNDGFWGHLTQRACLLGVLIFGVLPKFCHRKSWLYGFLNLVLGLEHSTSLTTSLTKIQIEHTLTYIQGSNSGPENCIVATLWLQSC